jgi:hypothetical protein
MDVLNTELQCAAGMYRNADNQHTHVVTSLVQQWPAMRLQINPHRIKDMDVQFMARLSQAVPVIPIMAKVRRAVPFAVCGPIPHSRGWGEQNLHRAERVNLRIISH